MVSGVPSCANYVGGSSHLLRKLGQGVLSMVYVCMVLTVVMVLAVAVGVGLVRFCVEQPVFLKDSLYFDYTELNPKAEFLIGGDGGFRESSRMKQMGVPVGHTFYVSVVLFMPESDYNRDIGVFQVSALLKFEILAIL